MFEYISSLVRSVLWSTCIVLSMGCTDSAKISRQQAVSHVHRLIELTVQDAREVREGLPAGAVELQSLFKAKLPPSEDLSSVRSGLARARDHVDLLRSAKSTFFALAGVDGVVYRTDREPDVLAGKSLFVPFPGLRGVLSGNKVEARGSMAEMGAIPGKSNANWVYAVPVTVEGTVRGVYATGWSWSAYAYRLETALRSEVRAAAYQQKTKEPLTYVYIIVDKEVFGAPVSPAVNAQAIQGLAPLDKTVHGPYNAKLEITERDFGVAIERAPIFGDNIAVAVLRSET